MMIHCITDIHFFYEHKFVCLISKLLFFLTLPNDLFQIDHQVYEVLLVLVPTFGHLNKAGITLMN